MPALEDPTASYPALAIEFLPPVVQGLFYLGLLATVMSTVDGYTFIGGVNFGRDLLWRLRREPDDSRVNLYSQSGFLVTAALAVVLALFFRSAVDLWHDVGSVGVPALLVPLGSSYHPRLRMRPAAAVWSIALSGAAALGWLLSRSPTGTYPLGLEPIYVGLGLSVAIWAGDRLTRGARVL
jgi:SSS family solute:Na+ symporter